MHPVDIKRTMLTPGLINPSYEPGGVPSKSDEPSLLGRTSIIQPVFFSKSGVSEYGKGTKCDPEHIQAVLFGHHDKSLNVKAPLMASVPVRATREVLKACGRKGGPRRR